MILPIIAWRDHLPPGVSRWGEANARFLRDFGVAVDRPADGMLQDVHWAVGLFGYFPTYALGNLLSVQYYNTALKAHPNLPDEFAQGKFDTLLTWLNENIHRAEVQQLFQRGLRILSSLDLETVLETIVARAVDLSGTDCGVIYEFDEVAQEFNLRASHRMEQEAVEALRAARIRAGEGAAGHRLGSGARDRGTLRRAGGSPAGRTPGRRAAPPGRSGPRG